MTTIRITDLKLKTIIGTMKWERTTKQAILINIVFEYDARKAAQTDSIKHAVDYKTITKRIIREVEKSKFHLVERLCEFILSIVMSNKAVKKAAVRVDKPLALRFAKSVSAEATSKR